MNWLIGAVRSSIGKKTIMAVSGIKLSLFLAIHLLGNTTVFWGRAAFTSYADHLQILGPLLHLLEIGLVMLFTVHISLGLFLCWQNRQARPQRYAVRKSAGGESWGARTMPYTGLIILTFLIVHLLNFRFNHSLLPLASLVKETLSQPSYAGLYLLAMVALILHTSHGFWSLWQSLGINHPKYNIFLQAVAQVASVLAGATFSLIPLLALFYSQFLR